MNTYYKVGIAIKMKDNIPAIVCGTSFEVVRDYAAPYNKVYWRDEYEFREEYFDTEAEAVERQQRWDRHIGVDFTELTLDLTGEKAVIRRREA